MADKNGYNYELTIHFSDGDIVTEYFMQAISVERAKKSWYATQEADTRIGETYEITGFDVKEL